MDDATVFSIPALRAIEFNLYDRKTVVSGTTVARLQFHTPAVVRTFGRQTTADDDKKKERQAVYLLCNLRSGYYCDEGKVGPMMI